MKKCTFIQTLGIGIEKFKTQLRGRVIIKGDSGYDTARKNWDPHTDRFPKGFVFEQKIRDVANAIKRVRKNNVPIRPRSGRSLYKVQIFCAYNEVLSCFMIAEQIAQPI